MDTFDDATDLSGMPFMNLLLDSQRGYKRRRTHRRTHRLTHSADSHMTLFATQYLAPPLGKARKSVERHRDDVDGYLSSDLELSFASNVSLNSPPRRQSQLPDCDAMDISPAPRRAALDIPGPKSGRPRALTSSSRLFGSDISNSSPSLLPSPKFPEAKPTSGTTNAKKLQRSALPTEWMAAMRPPALAKPTLPAQPSSPMDDAMDVDTSSYHNSPAVVMKPVDFSPVPRTAAPTATGFNNLFYDTLSPRRSFESPSHKPKKRRSLSPESNRAIIKDIESSPTLPPSPSESKFERMSNPSRNPKPSLQGLGAPAVSFMKRQRRPVLSEVVHPNDFNLHSADLDMSPGLLSREDGNPVQSLLPPTRRAFSALLPPSTFPQAESDSSFEGPDMSSPAQAYAARKTKTIRRCDGTEDFRPLTGATALVMNESPSQRFLAPGMPGFGDNEAIGKILPCHRVTEDGLMRISVQTLDSLLDGRYEGKVHNFHIIDCRFDYEYKGGHIEGATNINTTAQVEELLLRPNLNTPKPSVSGDKTAKTILIFHCEFSAKRAPTFAKHLRAKDRAMNNHNYPKIHYPEVYILEGGYCNYFKTSSRFSVPKAYVTMDDPNHAISRQQDMDQFRKAKFGRHKSYAYGEGPMKPSSSSQQGQPKRNTAPNSLFAAATAARSRRAGSLTTLAEDANTTAETEHEDTDTDLGDSPCPPPNKSAALKVKKPNRHLVRSETFCAARMPLNFN